MTEIPTEEGKLYLATVIDLCSRRLLAAPTTMHPNAELACDAIRMAVAVRGGAESVRDVVFHTDRGSTYTAGPFTTLCSTLKIRQSMGRTGSCFDNSAAESLFSTLEWEVLSRHHFATREEARQIISTCPSWRQLRANEARPLMYVMTHYRRAVRRHFRLFHSSNPCLDACARAVADEEQ